MLGHGFLSVQLQREPDLGSQATLSPKFPECHLQMSPVPGLEGGGLLACKSRARARQAVDKEAAHEGQAWGRQAYLEGWERAQLGSEWSFRNSKVWCRAEGGPLMLEPLEPLGML
jgi:hypothetical protein